MSSLVSIIIPAYNAEPWIGTALASALAQTWSHTEIIVVDDGSTDSTLAVAKQYASARVKVITQENQGPATARNRGLQEAQGDYIQYLDADDLLSPDKIEEQLRILRGGGSDLLAVSKSVCFRNGESPEGGRVEPWPMQDSDDPVAWLIELWGPDGQPGMVPVGAWLTPRAVAGRAGPWDNEMRFHDDDGEYFGRVVLASSGIRRTSGCYYYRKFPGRRTYSSILSKAFFLGRLYSVDCERKALLARTNSLRAKRALANRYMEVAFGSYPSFRDVSAQAILRAKELGGTEYFPPFGTWKGQVLSRVVGWKMTKRLNVTFHAIKQVFVSSN